MPAGRRFRGTISFPFTVLAIGTIATVLAADQVRRSVIAVDRERFEFAADRLQDSIQDRVNMYVAMLRAGAGLLAAADIHSPQQFRAFVDRLALQERYPGVQGIGYSERILPAELDRAIAAQRNAEDPEFHLWPEGARPEYHSILYLEPLDRRNQAAIGYDMFTEPTRRAAMERARDTGAPAASGLVTLVQEIDGAKQPGFLIYMPVYEGGDVPATVEARRRTLQGFIYSPFRAGDLFAGILGRNPHPRAGFELYDGAPSPALLIHRTAVEGDIGRLSETRTIDVAGHHWTADVFSTPALDVDSNQALVPFTAWSGGAMTLLLTGLAALQRRARRRAEQSEVAAEEASRSLQEQANTLAIVNRTGAQLAGELDLDRLVQAVTDAGTKLTRAQFGAFFYNQVNAQGESYALYALSGVPRDAFAGFPMPRNTAVFGPTFRGEGIVRAGDITADPRYGRNPPHKGMPPGHLPVRSYLAAPVHASSEGPNRGATFTVRLPAVSDAAIPSSDHQERTHAPVDSRVLEDTTILVVDDDADANSLAREILSQRGARVISARSGAEALRLLQSDGPAPGLIVSDIGMPQMDGYELIRRVRALPAEMGGAARAIALTAYAGAEDRMRAIAAGYDVHLAKPFTPDDLVAACTALLGAGSA